MDKKTIVNRPIFLGWANVPAMAGAVKLERFFPESIVVVDDAFRKAVEVSGEFKTHSLRCSMFQMAENARANTDRSVFLDSEISRGRNIHLTDPALPSDYVCPILHYLGHEGSFWLSQDQTRVILGYTEMEGRVVALTLEGRGKFMLLKTKELNTWENPLPLVVVAYW